MEAQDPGGRQGHLTLSLQLSPRTPALAAKFTHPRGSGQKVSGSLSIPPPGAAHPKSLQKVVWSQKPARMRHTVPQLRGAGEKRRTDVGRAPDGAEGWAVL